jgi:hypothetical protein
MITETILFRPDVKSLHQTGHDAHASKFLLKDKGTWIAIDNSSGEGFVEEFKEFHVALAWLVHAVEMSEITYSSVKLTKSNQVLIADALAFHFRFHDKEIEILHHEPALDTASMSFDLSLFGMDINLSVRKRHMR